LAKMLFRLPDAARVIANPSVAELQQLAARMPTARWTRYGNLNVQTNVLARSTPSTFIVTDEDDSDLAQTIARDEAEAWAAKQDAYIATQEMVLFDGRLRARADRDHHARSRGAR
jgi:phosphoenolpyruvate carboxykinase (ATP)